MEYLGFKKKNVENGRFWENFEKIKGSSPQAPGGLGVFSGLHCKLGGSPQDLDTWLITMVSKVRPPRPGVVANPFQMAYNSLSQWTLKKKV